MKVLVVGGAGYVGGVVTDLFIKQKHKVLVYDNLTYEESFRKNCDFINKKIFKMGRLSSLDGSLSRRWSL